MNPNSDVNQMYYDWLIKQTQGGGYKSDGSSLVDTGEFQPSLTYQPPNMKSSDISSVFSSGSSAPVTQGRTKATSSRGSMSSAGIQSATGWSDLVNSFIANRMHQEYAKKLETTDLTPASIYEAESGYRNNATRGLQGVDTMRQSLFSSIPAMTNKAQEVGQSTSVLKALSDSYTNVENALSQLNITDADAKVKNQMALMQFLSSVKAPYDEANIAKMFAAERERQAGKKELMAGASSLVQNESGAVGSILDMFMGSGG